MNSLNNNQIQEKGSNLWYAKLKVWCRARSKRNGQVDKKEPGLESVVFWDRDDDGELNKTKEPYIFTNNQGHFAFEWISGKFPTELSLSSILKGAKSEQSGNLILFPLHHLPCRKNLSEII